MNNPFEPPRTTPEKATAALARTIPFNVVVGSQDVNAATGQIRSTVTLIFVLIPLMLLNLLLLIGFLRHGLANSDSPLPVISMMLISGIMGLLLWRNLSATTRIMNSYPLAFGHMWGQFSADGVHITTEHGSSFHPLRALLYAEVRNRVLIFAFDRNSIVRYYLPERAFTQGGFDEVAAFLTSSATPLPAGDLVDERVLVRENLLPIELEPNAIAISGCLTMDDFCQSEVRQLIALYRRKVFLWVCSLCFVFSALPIAMYLYSQKLLLAFVVAAIGTWLILRLLKRTRRALGAHHRPDQVLLELKGGIEAAGLHVATPLGVSKSNWSMFVSFAKTGDIVSLRLPGTSGHHVILTRRLFSKESDWTRAIAILESSIPTAEGRH
jgi:hypothetical protein